MSESDENRNLPVPHRGWSLPDWVIDLKQIPGAATAIARLVGSLGKAGASWVDVGTAAGESRAQEIRDKTNARTALTNEAVKVAAKQMNKDPDLAFRTIDHVLGRQIKEQENREAIAVKTIEHLHEEPPQDPNSTPSEDWMNVFEGYAEKASSETLREHWARILAGEIRKPGSYSLMTLQFMSVLDPTLAATVERVAPLVADGGFLFDTPESNEGQPLLDLVSLDAVGFLRRGLSRYVPLDQDGRALAIFGNMGLLLHGTPGSRLNLGGSVLTQLGNEVLSIVRPTPDIERIRGVARSAYQSGARDVQLIHILERQGTNFRYQVIEVIPGPSAPPP